VAVLFAFLYVRRAFGAVSGIAAALLFAFTPYLVETSHELLTDMPAVALMLAAMWLFDKPGPRFAILAGAAYALAVQTRFTSLFLIVYFALDASLSGETTPVGDSGRCGRRHHRPLSRLGPLELRFLSVSFCPGKKDRDRMDGPGPLPLLFRRSARDFSAQPVAVLWIRPLVVCHALERRAR